MNKKKPSGFRTFACGMVLMYALLTSVVLYSASAYHPNDNMWRTAVVWPWRLVSMGVAMRYRWWNPPRQYRGRGKATIQLLNGPVGGVLKQYRCYELDEGVRPPKRLQTKTTRVVSAGLGHAVVALVEAEDAVEGQVHAHDEARVVAESHQVEEAVRERVPG